MKTIFPTLWEYNILHSNIIASDTLLGETMDNFHMKFPLRITLKLYFTKVHTAI